MERGEVVRVMEWKVIRDVVDLVEGKMRYCTHD